MYYIQDMHTHSSRVLAKRCRNYNNNYPRLVSSEPPTRFDVRSI